MDMNVSFKIAAGVTGQQAVESLKTSMERLGNSASVVGKGTLSLANSFGALSNPIGAATGLLTRFVGVLGVAGVVGGLTAVVKSALNAGDELFKMSQKTGVSVEALSTFKMAAELSDVSLEQLGNALIKFDVSSSKAITGSKELAGAFKAVGLSVADVQKMDTEQRLLKVADAFAGMEDGASKTRIAVDLFGKAGAGMIPLLNMGSEAIERLGIKLTTDFAARAEAFNDSITIIGIRVKNFTTSAVGELLPTLEDVMDAFMDVVDTKPDVVGFMDAVGEVLRMVSLTAVGLWSALKVTANSIVELGSAAKNAAFGNFEAAKANIDGIAAYYKKTDEEYLKFQTKILRDSLLFGAGTVEEIKDRQRNRTPGRTSRTGSADLSGLGSGGADPFEAEMLNLGREAAKLRFQSSHVTEFQEKITTAKEAMIRFDIEQGKFKDLSVAQKDAILQAARAVDQYGVSLKQNLAGLDYDKQTKKILAETEAIGYGNLAKQQYIALQDLENKGIEEGSELYSRLAESRMSALQDSYNASRSFGTGLQSFVTSYVEDATNSAKQIKDSLTGAFNAASDALVDFVTTGKFNFTNFATSILKDLARIAIQRSILAPIAGLLGSVLPALGGAAISGMGTTAGGAGAMAFPVQMNANGNAFMNGSVTAFANGGVVGSPTLFPMANGMGLMGEAGPEAIMPLSRDSSGRLGVKSQGGGSGDQFNISVTVATDGSMSSKGNSQAGEGFGRVIAGAVRQEIMNQKRPGGLLAAGAIA